MFVVSGYLVSRLIFIRNRAQRVILAKLTVFVFASVVIAVGFPGYLIMQMVNHFVQDYMPEMYDLSAAGLKIVADRWEVIFLHRI